MVRHVGRGASTERAEAVKQWKLFKPDVSLLDLRMPILDGVGAISAIRQFDSNARIIILTRFDDEEDVYRA